VPKPVQEQQRRRDDDKYTGEHVSPGDLVVKVRIAMILESRNRTTHQKSTDFSKGQGVSKGLIPLVTLESVITGVSAKVEIDGKPFTALFVRDYVK
jgi:hypothetical protein